MSGNYSTDAIKTFDLTPKISNADVKKASLAYLTVLEQLTYNICLHIVLFSIKISK